MNTNKAHLDNLLAEKLLADVLAHQVASDQCHWLLKHLRDWIYALLACMPIILFLTFDTNLFIPALSGETLLITFLAGRLFYAQKKRPLIEQDPAKWVASYFIGAAISTCIQNAVILYIMLNGTSTMRAVMLFVSCILSCINATLISIQFPIAIFNIVLFLCVPTYALFLSEDIFLLKMLGLTSILIFFSWKWAKGVGESINKGFYKERINQFLIKNTQADRDALAATLNDLQNTKKALHQHDEMLEQRVRERTQALEREVSKTQTTAHEIQRLAITDALTGLLNRRALEELLANKFQRAIEQNKTFALIFMDLDKFKQINDTMGHLQGDIVLKEAALRLKGIVRTSDTIARWGGDEFVVIAEEINTIDKAQVLGEKLIQALKMPILKTEQPSYIGSSLGVAFFPQDAKTIDSLISCADQAAYEAKRAGGNKVHFYRAELSIEAQSKKAQQDALNHAIENDELALSYHAILNADSHILGFRVCPIWQTKNSKKIHGRDLDKIAEDPKISVSLLKWQLRKACEEAPLHLTQLDTRLVLAFTERQIANTNLYHTVVDILQTTGWPAQRLAIEVDENTIKPDNDRLTLVLFALRDLGVLIIQADFGTSAIYLSQMTRQPVDIVRVNSNFLDINGHDNLADATIKLAKQFNYKVWVHGISTPLQLSMARHYQIDGLSGTLIDEIIQTETATSIEAKTQTIF